MKPCKPGGSEGVLSRRGTNAEIVRAYRAAREAGDTRAMRAMREAIVVSNQGLVRKMVMRYTRPQTDADTEDAMQAGSMGLLRALEDYEPAKSSFSTYATYWIRDHIQQWGGKPTTVSRPRTSSMPAAVVDKASQIRMREGREPTAEELGVSQSKLDAWAEVSRFVYLDEISDEHGTVDLPADTDDEVDRMSLERALRSASLDISTRNRDIAEAVLVRNESPQSVAERYGYRTSAVVTRICERVEARLRRSLRDEST